MAIDWAAFGVDLHLVLATAPGRRAALEQALRQAIRAGRLGPRTRLPSSRALAADLGLARGTVSAAYDQLVAEGYLEARTGSGTVVAGLPAARDLPAGPARTAPAPRYDLRPGSPDVTTFPTAAWLRALRRAVATAPSPAFDYGQPQGSIELRTALAEYLGRVRGVRATPDRIVITSGYVQALALLTGVLAGAGTAAIAMEDPSFGFHRDVVRHNGARVVALPVDGRGARTDLLSTADYSAVRAAVLTPAHQYPLGVTLHPERRHAATAWAARHDALVIEDDYDGEFRYDRQPIGALQGTAPEHVVYIGTASKTLGPALRLGWMVLPDRLVTAVAVAKRHTDLHSETLGQLALADMIKTHGYDRHVRSCRLLYRRRRDLLVECLASSAARGLAIEGIAAGLHVTIRLPDTGPGEDDIVHRAAGHDLAVGRLDGHWHSPGPHPHGLIVGYSGPAGGAYPGAVDRLVRVLST